MPSYMLRDTRRKSASAHVEMNEVIYSDEELEFLKAVERFQRERRIRNPSCSDILMIAYSLGYTKEPT